MNASNRSQRNSINWAARTVVMTKQHAWQDETRYRVPFTGTFDANKIYSVLHARLFRPNLGKFGGGMSIAEVVNNNDGTFSVSTLYSIGD